MAQRSSLDDQIIVAIRRISQAVEAYSRFLWQEYELTGPQLGALREIQRAGETTPSHLARAVHLSPQTMAGILKRLEQRGLIERSRGEQDKRSFSLRISQEGDRLANAAPSLLRDQFRSELEKLEVWERTQLLSTLQRVASMMSAGDVDDAPFISFELPANEETPSSSGSRNDGAARRRPANKKPPKRR